MIITTQKTFFKNKKRRKKTLSSQFTSIVCVWRISLTSCSSLFSMASKSFFFSSAIFFFEKWEIKERERERRESCHLSNLSNVKKTRERKRKFSWNMSNGKKKKKKENKTKKGTNVFILQHQESFGPVLWDCLLLSSLSLHLFLISFISFVSFISQKDPLFRLFHWREWWFIFAGFSELRGADWERDNVLQKDNVFATRNFLSPKKKEREKEKKKKRSLLFGWKKIASGKYESFFDFFVIVF